MMQTSEKPADWGRQIRAMFSGISAHYDLMNRLMTFGQDSAWRRAVVAAAAVESMGRVLDIGAGTGGIGRAFVTGAEARQVVCADFTPEMMAVGRRHPRSRPLQWCAADALHLPFSDAAFDVVASGYLIRNVSHVLTAFREQVRVAVPGGRVVCLDTTPPQATAVRPLVDIFMGHIIPVMGRLVSGDAGAYTYLPESTQRFLTPTALAGVMRAAGLIRIRWRTFMFGTMAIHVGEKPGRSS
jgi:demethylmenaquinone methyltransferase/2-methoxy-6-polyprenyl-1,4-benzoquinol methylase